ncbi:hypothetical protein BDR07DRAFT_1383648 [Suillus spraguei]|nr:hypothetical protein BDR07DRAFT_1383648 [Suillus spraguei]
MAAKLDQTPKSIRGLKWPVARDLTVYESAPAVPTTGSKVNADSSLFMAWSVPFGIDFTKKMLQLVLLSSSLFINLTGRLWIVFAGEGASVVYSAAITAAGFTHELANTTTFEYVKAIIDLLMCPLCRPDGKVLIIGGGIGNFTNVTTTFKDHPCPHVLTHRTLYFRRGGFNLHVEGLKALCLLGSRTNYNADCSPGSRDNLRPFDLGSRLMLY